jgi:hypothetical protein
MNNVVAFTGPDQKQNVAVEAAFVGLLDHHCAQEGAVKPLPSHFFDRIGQLKAKAELAKQAQENTLMEG